MKTKIQEKFKAMFGDGASLFASPGRVNQELYVRSRRSIGVGTNEARMARQEEYLSRLFALLDARQKEDREFVGTVYDALDAYLVTDLSRGQMINEAWSASGYERTALIRPEGVHQVGTCLLYTSRCV